MFVRRLLALSCVTVVCVALAPGALGKTDGNTSQSTSSSDCKPERTLASSGRETTAQTFDDYIQDTRGPDICGQNSVGNDNEGWITFGMHIHNRTTFAPNEIYAVLIDTDLNLTTGLDGADYRVRVTAEAVQLGKWDGTSFGVQSTRAPAVWQQGYGPVFQVNARDLGGVQSFGFFLAASDGVNADVAPNRGAWSYRLTPLALTTGQFLHSPARPGASFTALLAVRRSDLNTTLTEGTIACAARIGAKPLRGTGRFVLGGVGCNWKLRRRSRGKRFSGSVAVTFQGAEAKRSFNLKVR